MTQRLLWESPRWVWFIGTTKLQALSGEQDKSDGATAQIVRDATSRAKFTTVEAYMDKETYLGDAVYVSFDGYHIWLRTGDGNNQRIALEPAVFDALIDYRRRLYEALTEKTKEAESESKS